MSTAAVTSVAGHEQRLHPLPLRIMHWINAVAIFIMIGSGWKIYNDDVILGWLHFPDAVVIGIWAQYGLQWHFFGMWIFVLNGIAYLTYGIVTGRFRQKLFPITFSELFATINDALHFRLGHDDLTVYNAVQKILYLGVILVGILIVITGLCLWKPVQFSELASLFYNFQTIRVIHFLCMAAIVGFIVVHVSLALLVPRTLVAMVTGGPVVNGVAVLALRPAPMPVPASVPPAPLPEQMPEPAPAHEPPLAAAAEPPVEETPGAESPPLGPINEPTK